MLFAKQPDVARTQQAQFQKDASTPRAKDQSALKHASPTEAPQDQPGVARARALIRIAKAAANRKAAAPLPFAEQQPVVPGPLTLDEKQHEKQENCMVFSGNLGHLSNQSDINWLSVFASMYDQVHECLHIYIYIPIYR